MSWLETMFPASCAGCGVPGPLGCPKCLALLSGPAVPAWPQPTPVGLPSPWAVAVYADPCRALLLAYKEQGAIGLRHGLAAPLAASIDAAWQARLLARGAVPVPSQLLVVPVPSSRRAVRMRGDDVVLVLTRRAVAILRPSGVKVRVLPALRHRRRLADSAGLSAGARAANLADAFAVRGCARRAVAGATVILADDLITTGVSLAEAARALRSCGADVVGAATVAATQRRGDGAASALSRGRSSVEEKRVGHSLPDGRGDASRGHRRQST
jgi:predicted amidophosphoribosyltransferase